MMRISNQYGKSTTWTDTDNRKDYGSKKWENELIHIQSSGEHPKICSTITFGKPCAREQNLQWPPPNQTPPTQQTNQRAREEQHQFQENRPYVGGAGWR
jgi:hypothetical protein